MINLQASRDRDVYPDFAELKALVARVLVTLHFDAPLGSAGTIGMHRHHGVRSAAILRAGRITDLQDNAVRIDVHLRSVVAAVQSEVASLPAAPAREQGAEQELTARVGRLQTDVAAIDCMTCARGAARSPCNGRWQDTRLQRGDVRCLDHLRGLFDLAVAVGNRAYAPVPHHGGNRTVTIGLRALPGSGARTNATTSFPADDCATSRTAEVRILLPTTSFEVKNYYQTLYGLLHEVIVHAPQTLGVAGRRGAHGDDCPFSEGFIDSAAVQAFHDAIGDPSSLPPPERERLRYFNSIGLTGRLRAGVTNEHNTRTDPDKLPPSFPFSAANERERALLGHRWSGRQSFEDLKSFEGQVQGAAGRSAVHLALAINLLDLDEDKRLEFLMKLKSALARDRTRRTLKDLERQKAVQRFLTRGDWPGLQAAFNLT